MPMLLESNSREAFELVTEALEHLDDYRESRDYKFLDAAKQMLTAAKAKDPNYFRAFYFDAIVDDLSGRSVQAVQTFELLDVQETPFANEVRYNYAVASYHHYYHEALDRA